MESILNAALERFSDLLDQATEIWRSGGWAMIAIATIAMVMFGLGIHIKRKLIAKGLRSVPEDTWRYWLDHPEKRRGPIGELLDRVTSTRTAAEQARLFEELRATEMLPFERDLKVMKVCVSATPLVGLLGTVTGMLSTFGALALGSGGEQTMDMVAKGISEALVTTETGLVIAIPGLFLQYRLRRGFDSYKAFLAHLETVCTQKQQRGERKQVRDQVKRAALDSIRRRLFERLQASEQPAPPAPRAESEPAPPQHPPLVKS